MILFTINYDVLYYKNRLNRKKSFNCYHPMLLYKKYAWKSFLNGIKDYKINYKKIYNMNVNDFIYNIIDILQYRDVETLHIKNYRKGSYDKYDWDNHSNVFRSKYYAGFDSDDGVLYQENN